jgi:catalase
MAKSMGKARIDIKERMIKVCTQVHPEFGERLAKALDIKPSIAKL